MACNMNPSLAFSFLVLSSILLLPPRNLIITFCRAESEIGMLSRSLARCSLVEILYRIIEKSRCMTMFYCPDDESAFTYTKGTDRGPEKWGLINPEWKACGHGKMQSPIDLLNRRVEVWSSLGKLKRDYKPAPATLVNRGHDIMVTWEGYAGKININGTYYNLRQCHWHSPSEHTLNGSRYNLELHIVHESSDGKVAVIGILYKYGRPDRFLTKLFHHISAFGHGKNKHDDEGHDGHEEKDLGIVNPGEIKFGSRKYYRYMGSLTVPPCTEGIVWTISKKGFEANARPTQKPHDRKISLYSPRAIRGPA
ncbi:hypothetical protein CDL15_Pgr003101 [Punica granatum]|uniref:Carbonic anhydrase n=1 Tax=Punica granatum TaxID=22663 RepID=A0A218X2P1_PUNGR|nr:hypothetical protein CDL15_Pgr003101 [Punica granatum]